jgi:hypothetical protein
MAGTKDLLVPASEEVFGETFDKSRMVPSRPQVRTVYLCEGFWQV